MSRSDDVWAALEADPEFVAGMERARADFEAGRFTPYRHIVDPLRPPETDQQPDLTDIATHASGVWLTAVVAVAAAFFVAAYLWSRS